MHPDLKVLGKQALEEHPDDAPKAVNWLINKLLHDEALFQAHVVPIVTETSRGIIRYLQGQQRHQTRKYAEVMPLPVVEPKGQPAEGKKSTTAATQEVPPRPLVIRGRQLAAAYNWLNYPVGQKLLGDMTREELLKAAALHLTSGRTQIVNGYFFTSVSERLPDDKTPVRKVLSHTELQALRNTAETKVA